MGPFRDWRVVRWGRDHRFGIDVGVAVVFIAVAMLGHFVQDESNGQTFRDPTWWTVPLVVVACVPLAWRRVRPIPAAIATVGAQLVVDGLRINGPAWIGVAMVLYCLGSYADGRARLRTLALVGVATVGILAYAVAADIDGVNLGTAVFLVSLLAVCFLVGDVIRRRRNEISTLAARAERAEHERELLAGQRVAEERTRIARDLHDIVAHSVSVMVIQATAARRNLERSPGAAAELLENIEATGRQTMGELRQILGVLRDTAGEVPPTTPVLSDLESLARSIPELDVRLTKTGSLEGIPTGVALSAYRVVQEALTNAHRHAGPNVTVDVHVECTPERVEVSVADDGRGASASDRTNGGYGLIGMGERVAAFGGKLRTGPRRSGGWEVRAHFPLTVTTNGQSRGEPVGS